MQTDILAIHLDKKISTYREQILDIEEEVEEMERQIEVKKSIILNLDRILNELYQEREKVIKEVYGEN